MTISTLLLLVLVLALIGVVPVWPHSRDWGYGPSGGTAVLLILVVALLMTGHI